MTELVHLEEPNLMFGHGQSLPNPKDGLTLFGPYAAKPGSVRIGVIGTNAAIEQFNKWSLNINNALAGYKGSRFTREKDSKYGKLAHQFFPGFEPTFHLSWNHPAEALCVVPDDVLQNALRTHDLHTRIARVTKVFTKRLTKLHFESEHKPDLWFVVIPKQVERLCRPRSEPPQDYATGTMAVDAVQRGLFSDQREEDRFTEEYQDALKFKPDFHNQLSVVRYFETEG